jgi:flagellar basal body-associated protein FliL
LTFALGWEACGTMMVVVLVLVVVTVVVVGGFFCWASAKGAAAATTQSPANIFISIRKFVFLRNLALPQSPA